jgi:integrase
MKSVTVERVIHKGESRIALRFSYDKEIESKVRSFPGARWSMTMKCWHLPDNQFTMGKMILDFGDRLSTEVSAGSGSLVDDKTGKTSVEHRLILWMIYSCGLRRSEVINIRIADLDRTRGILNIREAKGMNDRIVPVSDKIWEKVDEYVSSYHPVFWLFEGQTGGKYSSESVYRVFKQALSNAGIRKDVGVHSLRHSYATHLHESGVDIRYIQELLGHKSSRTTEIYTHVSRRNLMAVRSPIDDMDLK